MHTAIDTNTLAAGGGRVQRQGAVAARALSAVPAMDLTGGRGGGGWAGRRTSSCRCRLGRIGRDLRLLVTLQRPGCFREIEGVRPLSLSRPAPISGRRQPKPKGKHWKRKRQKNG